MNKVAFHILIDNLLLFNNFDVYKVYVSIPLSLNYVNILYFHIMQYIYIILLWDYEYDVNINNKIIKKISFCYYVY